MSHRILVTGGMGYIGSHTVIELLSQGYEVDVVDILETSNESTKGLIEEISGKSINLYRVDIRKFDDLLNVLKKKKYDAVIHFAAYKNVKDSQENPLGYYENNISGTINLLKAMKAGGVDKIVFSSSCSVYGQPEKLPVTEENPYAPLSPYARTKMIVEHLLKDWSLGGSNAIALRYFNAAGAHPAGKIGEDPKFLMNIIPRIFGAALGKYELKIFGEGFPTADGSQVRDYIHVMDLATAHAASVKRMLENKIGFEAYNIGTGKGTTVYQLIEEIESVTGLKVPYSVVDAIPGDPIEVYGDTSLAKENLGWNSKFDYKDIIRDCWKWYQGKEF